MSANHTSPTAACAAIAPLLPLAAHHLLAAEETQRLKQHLATCANCRAELASYQRETSALHQTLAGPSGLRSPFSQAEIARLLTNTSPSSARSPHMSATPSPAIPPSRRANLPRALAFVVVALAVVVGLVAIVGNTHRPSAATATAIGVLNATPYDYSYVYQSPKQGGTITYGTWLAPASANIASARFQSDTTTNGLLHALWGQCLIQLPDLSLGFAGWKPDQCREVPTVANGDESVDARTTTFRLDPNAKWSDGTPITSADYLFAYQMFLDPRIGGHQGEPPWNTTTVTAPDAHTLFINWGIQNGDFLRDIWTPEPLHAYNTEAYAGIYNPTTGAYDNTKARLLLADPAFLQHPVSNGPYMVQSYDSGGTKVVMVPNTHYFSNFFHKPALDQLIFEAAGSPSALIQGYKAGAYDMVQDLTIGDIGQFAEIPESQILVTFGSTIRSLAMNAYSQAPNAAANGHASLFADPNVRQAFVEAFNRCSAIKATFNLSACDSLLIATGELSGRPFTDFDPTIGPIAYNPSKAKQLMDAAGYHLNASGARTYQDGKTPISLQFAVTPSTTVGDLALMRAMIHAWQTNLGVQVTVQTLSGCVFCVPNNTLTPAQYDLMLVDVQHGTDPTRLIPYLQSEPHLDCSGNPCVTPDGRQFTNLAGVNDPLVDGAILPILTTLDPGIRLHLEQDLLVYLAHSSYSYTPMYVEPDITLERPTLGNHHQGIDLNGNTWNIADWYRNQ